MIPFDKERFEYLITYLDSLIRLKQTDHKVFSEIQSVLNELKTMLGLK